MDDEHDFLEIVDLDSEDAERSRREPDSETGPPRRRGPVIVAAIVVVALATSVIVGRTHRTNAKTATNTTSADPSHTKINLGDGPSGTRPLFPFLVGSQVLSGGQIGLHLIDTDTGLVSQPMVAGLPLGPVTIVAHSGGTVAVQAGAGLYWFTTQDLVAHLVATVDTATAFPAVQVGRLWIAGPRFATEVPKGPAITTTGRAVGATSAGLLLQTPAGIVLQPVPGTGAGAKVLYLPAPAILIGVHADRIAWMSNDCGVLRCPVHITEIAGRETSSWLQLVGHPSPAAIQNTSAVFSFDGSRIAVVVPNDAASIVKNVVVADLQSRTTRVVAVSEKFELPGTPGSPDANGEPVGWTLDGNYLVFAPSLVSGTTQLGVIDPIASRAIFSNQGLDVGASLAAVGVSSNGPLDRPRRTYQPVAPGGPTNLALPGLDLVGADDRQVDVIDLGTNRVRTWPLGGVEPNPAGPHSIARVVGGWLVVRNGVVDLLEDGQPTTSGLVDAGSQVFSAGHGRTAWILIANGGPNFDVESYDPATNTKGPRLFAASLGVPVGAVDAGLVTVHPTAPSGIASVEIDVVDASGAVRDGTVVNSADARVVAASGTNIAYTDARGLHVFDLTTKLDRLVSANSTANAVFSPDGLNLAWIGAYPGGAGENSALATRVDSDSISRLGDFPDRVMVADDGTVLFTVGTTVHRGQVSESGSTPVYGLAPVIDAELAFG